MATITPQPRPRSIPGSRISRRKQAYHSPVTKLMPWATTNRRGEAPSRARVLQGASVSTQPIRAPTGNPPRPIGDRPARSRRAREPAHEAFHGSITARSPSTNPPCETSFRNRWAPTGSAVGLAHVRYATPRWRFAPAACLGQHWGGRASSPSGPVRSRIVLGVSGDTRGHAGPREGRNPIRRDLRLRARPCSGPRCLPGLAHAPRNKRVHSRAGFRSS